MADGGKKVESKTDADRKPVVPRTALEIQRMQYEKLMKDPEKAVNIPQRPKEWHPNAPPEFVRFVMGSSAGAGSGEFHVYRSTRRRENNRVEHIERIAKKQELEMEYHKKLEENKITAEERTAKKRAKRQKKKAQAKKRKQMEKEETKQPGAEEETWKNTQSDSEEEVEEEEPHFIVGGK